MEEFGWVLPSPVSPVPGNLHFFFFFWLGLWINLTLVAENLLL